MDPCPFVRVLVGNLALRMPVAPPAAGAGAGVHPSTSPCYCKIRLGKMPVQTVPAPLVVSDGGEQTPASGALAAAFHLSKADLAWFNGKPSLFSSGRLLGKATIPLDLKGAEAKPAVLHSGWISIGKRAGKGRLAAATVLSLTVRAEPDPRFVFEFDGEPECSPPVLQVGSTMKQPMFTCKFGCRSNSDLRRPGMQPERDAGASAKERKGWSVTVHDLKGSPVAMASMITPFVPSPGTDRVSRSNPGAWLILRPRRRRRLGALGAPRVLARARRRRRVRQPGLPLRPPRPRCGPRRRTRRLLHPLIQGRQVRHRPDRRAAAQPGRHAQVQPRGSGDLSNWPLGNYRGFVMSAAVQGEGRCSKPTVEVGVAHIRCAEDAAAFVALAAAVDLSMDACRLFSNRLRKELSHLRADLLR
ncbi:unnamed protein product [Miscanthus lutarioriparius]|uniref:Uncharacterized protein n=1 Tax=Miscanthus lutarioriparius TaxID=422564 RepID=A0A811MHH7_9POAL|nr:unnamed protein product [Miscanthus lutarioriparius]